MFTARVWPNGEFGVGFKKRFKPKPPVKAIPDDLSLEGIGGDDPDLHQRGVFTYVKSHLYRRQFTESDRAAVAAIAAGAPLGSSDVINSHKRAARGSSGLTSYARKMVRNGCFLLEQRTPRQSLCMFTGTIPPMPEENYRRVVESWPEIMRVFMQWISRRIEAHGCQKWIIGCTEVQEKRQKEYGGLPLHCHLVFQGRAKGSYALSVGDIRDKWNSMICNASGMGGGVFGGASCRIERIEKSAENYISKYASKGTNVEAAKAAAAGWKLPSSWWFGFGGIKRVIKKSIRFDSGQAALWLRACVGNDGEGCVYAGAVCPSPDKSALPVGWFGKLNRDYYRAFVLLC